MKKIAVVIPCYKVRGHTLTVVEKIGSEVDSIYIIDDCCPENSGKFVENNSDDPRLKVIYNKKNMGVGGAVMEGYKAAILDCADIIVKIDGDDQMDPALIEHFISPIKNGEADYTKGNRFFDLEKVYSMPKIRLIGNAVLSKMEFSKFKGLGDLCA